MNNPELYDSTDTFSESNPLTLDPAKFEGFFVLFHYREMLSERSQWTDFASRSFRRTWPEYFEAVTKDTKKTMQVLSDAISGGTFDSTALYAAPLMLRRSGFSRHHFVVASYLLDENGSPERFLSYDLILIQQADKSSTKLYVWKVPPHALRPASVSRKEAPAKRPKVETPKETPKRMSFLKRIFGKKQEKISEDEANEIRKRIGNVVDVLDHDPILRALRQSNDPDGKLLDEILSDHTRKR